MLGDFSGETQSMGKCWRHLCRLYLVRKQRYKSCALNQAMVKDVLLRTYIYSAKKQEGNIKHLKIRNLNNIVNMIWQYFGGLGWVTPGHSMRSLSGRRTWHVAIWPSLSFYLTMTTSSGPQVLAPATAGAALKRLERRGDPPTSTSTSSKWSNLSSRSNIKHKIYGGSTQTLDTRYYRYTDRDCSAPLPVVVIVLINYLCHYKITVLRWKWEFPSLHPPPHTGKLNSIWRYLREFRFIIHLFFFCL